MARQQRHHRASVAPMVDGREDQGLWSDHTLRAAPKPAALRAWQALLMVFQGDKTKKMMPFQKLHPNGLSMIDR